MYKKKEEKKIIISFSSQLRQFTYRFIDICINRTFISYIFVFWDVDTNSFVAPIVGVPFRSWLFFIIYHLIHAWHINDNASVRTYLLALNCASIFEVLARKTRWLNWQTSFERSIKSAMRLDYQISPIIRDYLLLALYNWFCKFIRINKKKVVFRGCLLISFRQYYFQTNSCHVLRSVICVLWSKKLIVSFIQ